MIFPRSSFLAVASAVLMLGTAIAAPVPTVLQHPPFLEARSAGSSSILYERGGGGHINAAYTLRATKTFNEQGVNQYKALKKDYPGLADFADNMIAAHDENRAAAETLEDFHRNPSLRTYVDRPMKAIPDAKAATVTAKESIEFAKMLREHSKQQEKKKKADEKKK